MSDQNFLREVEEAVRHERYRQLWDRYGLYVIVAGALIVVGVAGYKGWAHWQQSRAQTAGSEFSKALLLQDKGQADKAREAFAELAEKGPSGYRLLSRLQLAVATAQAGKSDEAVSMYDALAAEAGDPIIKGLATIQAATLRLEQADYAEMERRLKPLIDSGSQWRYSARELLGLSAYKLKNMSEAEKQFSELLADRGTPANLRERAEMMLAVVAGSPQTLNTTAK